MQMVLASTLCVLDSLFQNLFGLFNKLTVEIDGISVNSSISTRVCLLRLGRTMLTFAVFLARKVSQSVVFGFGVARLLVVEG